jgi:hypothetical protein
MTLAVQKWVLSLPLLVVNRAPTAGVPWNGLPSREAAGRGPTAFAIRVT